MYLKRAGIRDKKMRGMLLEKSLVKHRTENLNEDSFGKLHRKQFLDQKESHVIYFKKTDIRNKDL